MSEKTKFIYLLKAIVIVFSDRENAFQWSLKGYIPKNYKLTPRKNKTVKACDEINRKIPHNGSIWSWSWSKFISILYLVMYTLWTIELQSKYYVNVLENEMKHVSYYKQNIWYTLKVYQRKSLKLISID